MRHELTRLPARARQAEPVHHVVEPALEQLEEDVARGGVLAPACLLDVTAELLLTHAVDHLQLLRLAQLGAVDALPGAATVAVLARPQRTAALQRGLAGERALALQPEVGALAAFQLLDRSGVTAP